MNNTTSLFVGDLPKFCTEQDLEQLFVRFGPIMDVKIKRNMNTGKTLSYGFITLANEMAASDALRSLDQTMFHGRRLRIRWAMYNARSPNNVQQDVINSVYIRFVTPRTERLITEEDLHRVFDHFGHIIDVSIKDSTIDPMGLRQSGYGFVHFSCDELGIESAFQAVSLVDNATIEGVTYNVELSKNLLKQFNDPARKSSMNTGANNISHSDMNMLPSHPIHSNPSQRHPTYPVPPIAAMQSYPRIPPMQTRDNFSLDRNLPINDHHHHHQTAMHNHPRAGLHAPRPLHQPASNFRYTEDFSRMNNFNMNARHNDSPVSSGYDGLMTRSRSFSSNSSLPLSVDSSSPSLPERNSFEGQHFFRVSEQPRAIMVKNLERKVSNVSDHSLTDSEHAEDVDSLHSNYLSPQYKDSMFGHFNDSNLHKLESDLSLLSINSDMKFDHVPSTFLGNFNQFQNNHFDEFGFSQSVTN